MGGIVGGGADEEAYDEEAEPEEAAGGSVAGPAAAYGGSSVLGIFDVVGVSGAVGVVEVVNQVVVDIIMYRFMFMQVLEWDGSGGGKRSWKRGFPNAVDYVHLSHEHARQEQHDVPSTPSYTVADEAGYKG